MRTSSSVSASRLKCVIRWFAFSVNAKPSAACSRHVASDFSVGNRRNV